MHYQSNCLHDCDSPSLNLLPVQLPRSRPFAWFSGAWVKFRTAQSKILQCSSADSTALHHPALHLLALISLRGTSTLQHFHLTIPGILHLSVFLGVALRSPIFGAETSAAQCPPFGTGDVQHRILCNLHGATFPIIPLLTSANYPGTKLMHINVQYSLTPSMPTMLSTTRV